PPDQCPAHSGVFQLMTKSECHFINGTEKMRYLYRYFYNREQLLHFDSDLGHYVGDTPYGEKVARFWNSQPATLEYYRSQVDTVCRLNYELSIPLLMER
ncbi:HB2L protein, partial [Regulus satrapa]|nr:HB2L protein [Regulus satrapa]